MFMVHMTILGFSIFLLSLLYTSESFSPLVLWPAHKLFKDDPSLKGHQAWMHLSYEGERWCDLYVYDIGVHSVIDGIWPRTACQSLTSVRTVFTIY